MDNVIDFEKAREEARVNRGEAGFFVNCPPDPTDMLEELGEGELEAVGLMFAQGGPEEPGFCGWVLTAEQARTLGEALIKLAGRCK